MSNELLLPSRWERALRGALKGSSLNEESVAARVDTLVWREAYEESHNELAALRNIVRRKRTGIA